MVSKHEISGIVLAGGNSSRMGRDKAFLYIEGKPLIDYAIDILSPISNTICISSSFQISKKQGFNIVLDEFENCGPLSGLASTLKTIETNHAFVISVDTPLVPNDLYEILLKFKNESNIVIPSIANNVEPLTGIFSKCHWRTISEYLKTGKRSVINYIKQNEHKIVELPKSFVEKYPDMFLNVNTPGDAMLLNNILIRTNKS